MPKMYMIYFPKEFHIIYNISVLTSFLNHILTLSVELTPKATKKNIEMMTKRYFSLLIS